MLMDYPEAFRLIDGYSCIRFRCFVAGLFPDKTQLHHNVCFRPTNDLAVADVYACKYLQIANEDLERCTFQHALTSDVEALLARELQGFVNSLTPET